MYGNAVYNTRGSAGTMVTAQLFSGIRLSEKVSILFE